MPVQWMGYIFTTLILNILCFQICLVAPNPVVHSEVMHPETIHKYIFIISVWWQCTQLQLACMSYYWDLRDWYHRIKPVKLLQTPWDIFLICSWDDGAHCSVSSSLLPPSEPALIFTPQCSTGSLSVPTWKWVVKKYNISRLPMWLRSEHPLISQIIGLSTGISVIVINMCNGGVLVRNGATTQIQAKWFPLSDYQNINRTNQVK